MNIIWSLFEHYLDTIEHYLLLFELFFLDVFFTHSSSFFCTFIFLGKLYGAEGGTIPQIFCSRWMKDMKSQSFKRKRKKWKKKKLATCCNPFSPPLSPFFRLFPLFPHFLPVLSPSQHLFSRFSLSSPP